MEIGGTGFRSGVEQGGTQGFVGRVGRRALRIVLNGAEVRGGARWCGVTATSILHQLQLHLNSYICFQAYNEQ